MTSAKKIVFGFVGVVILISLFFIYTNTQDKGLDLFAKSYAAYRDQQYDTFIYSYVPVVDASSETGEDNYFTYLSNAIDSTQTNNYRATNAELALSEYDSRNRVAMDTFSNYISKLDDYASELVVTSNQIKTSEYRDDAVKVAKLAREIEQNYSKQRLKYIERFRLQRDLLEGLVNNGGNMLALRTTLEKGGTKIPLINEDISVITKEIESKSQEMNDLYLSIKGRSNLADYPNKYTEN